MKYPRTRTTQEQDGSIYLEPDSLPDARRTLILASSNPRCGCRVALPLRCLFTADTVRGWRPIPFPASGHLVHRRPPAAVTREDHSACFVLEREHANDGVQISPQEQCRSRRRSLAPPFQRDDCGPRMKQITDNPRSISEDLTVPRHTCQSMLHEISYRCI